MPAIQSYITEPIWEQFRALLPDREVDHPLGCHRPRIPDCVVFEKLVQILVFGCAYWRIADESCSATTLRRRRDEWIEAGLMDALEEMAREAYDRTIGLELADVAVDCCITKAPCGGEKAGRSPVDRGKQGLKRSMMVDGKGIPLGVVSAPANRHDSPLLAPTLDALRTLGGLPESVSVHLDRGYDSFVTRRLLEERGLAGVISEKGRSAPLWTTKRWVIERTNSWTNAHKKLLWCTEREGRVIDFWVALSNAVIIVGRLVREAWSHYRWEGRPSRRP
ncbi:MAG: IS5 family transposase [Actinomycetota bacterium]|nr:IS5 family transposase [Actinomycetota bacterium]